MTYLTCRERWHAFKTDQSGASSMEYALIAGGLAVAVFVAVGTLSPYITSFYQAVADRVAALVTSLGI